MPPIFSCRWDWCRSSFASVDALDIHVKHQHIWPMKPMRKADIALMRRMDLQSLHSSPNTDSSISQGLIAYGVAPTKTPPSTFTSRTRADTFAQLSSPQQTPSPRGLPVSPAFESLVGRNRHFGLSAAMGLFERACGHKANQHPRSPQQRSPMHRPISESSGSSQEVVEQQLTQEEENVGLRPPPLPSSELQIENELVDSELRWPTDDELDVSVVEESNHIKWPVSMQSDRPSNIPDSARGQHFRCGSLNVPLGVNGQSVGPSHASQGSDDASQPIFLQTQAPYSSQTTDWSQSQ